MRKLRINHNEKGFTLIELMIVIAIIGILSAIAIPNFIAYRNKSFCSGVESDANAVAAAIADYFSIPSHEDFSSASFDPTSEFGIVLTGNNTGLVISSNANESITISITDGSGRCPESYADSVAGWTFVDGGDSYFHKNMAQQ